ncbi:RNA-binding KH domain-containing protein PEPPER [Ricinus communis]|uniref:Poly(RC)-binding protein, putative n=1 Tax=Ricinus communis TaxID=3988 RepID=B9RWX9_RICCO|nr:RNA-binding KH domain-containing protein PEPPER [Ricinus communis]EEF44134.1 Poly(rC)-binding protein, putative [Ricinus communis]|eukprot:XP_002518248.1 RNA-binding KH domain-containing protein PEPPER [Ricinus communis]
MAMATTTTTPEPTKTGSPDTPEPDSQAITTITTAATATSGVENPEPSASTSANWPGWPGDCVFRLIVPVLKVGSIIGRKGDLIKKMCDETRARIRVLDAPIGTPDRVVLISGKEDVEAPLSPAMDAVIRVFKRVSGLPEGNAQELGAAGIAFSSIRLLVASTQAINLIGKQGSIIKSIQESTGASVRVLSENEVPFYVATDERIVDLQGEAMKVLEALEAIVGHLRKFLVDHSVLPLFEKNYNALISLDRQAETWSDRSSFHTTSQGRIDIDYPLSGKRDALLLERETPFESQVPLSRISLYGQDPAISSVRSSVFNRSSVPIVTQVTQTMQVPISYAEEIIGIRGNNIEYIRRTSGAIITVNESRGLPDEIIVEIKGTASEVQMAQQLIQEFLSNHNKEPVTSSYSKYDTGLKSVYSQLDNSPYTSSSLSAKSYGEYGSSSLGGYSSFRL